MIDSNLVASPYMHDVPVSGSQAGGNGQANPSISTTPTTAAKPLKIAKITVDRDLCIGAAPCVTVAPGVFQLDDENKAYVVDPKGADDDMILLAAQACPVQAIILHDEEGNQIYP
jgi:ferredoxin